MLKKMIPYLLVLLAAFYGLPLLGLQSAGVMMILLLILCPTICLFTALLFSFRNGFRWYFPLAAGLLFLPTVWIYYNSSALVYPLLYAAIALLGCGMGFFFRRPVKK